MSRYLDAIYMLLVKNVKMCPLHQLTPGTLVNHSIKYNYQILIYLIQYLITKNVNCAYCNKM